MRVTLPGHTIDVTAHRHGVTDVNVATGKCMEKYVGLGDVHGLQSTMLRVSSAASNAAKTEVIWLQRTRSVKKSGSQSEIGWSVYGELAEREAITGLERGKASSGVGGRSLWSGGQGAKPPEAERL